MRHTLVLLRHAQAVDYASGRTDHQRPLTDKGRTQAARVGRALGDRGVHVDSALCSSSTRTRETLDGTGLLCPAEYSDAIYNASSDTIVEEIRGVDESVGTLIVVGHAPGIPTLAHELAGDGSDQQAVAEIRDRFPTATCCVLETDDPWAELTQGRLVFVTRG